MLDPLGKGAMPAQLEMEIVNEYGAHALHLKLGSSHVLLETAEIDEIMAALSLARVDLEPAVALQVPRDQRFPIETQPRWKTIVDPAFAGVVLFFRHSGYGWTGFAIPYPRLIELLEIDGRRVRQPVSQSVN